MKFKVYLKKEDHFTNGDSELWDNKQYDLLPFLFEIDVKDLNNFICTTINKDGVYYNICIHTMAEPFVAMADQIKNINLMNTITLYKNDPICPICGYKIYDSYDSYDTYTTICDGCGAELKISRDVEVTYNTTVLKKPRIIKV